MSGLVVKNNNELWFNNNKLSTSTGTKGLYTDINRNLFFNGAKIASSNLSNPVGLHLINNELAYDGTKFGTELNVLIRSLFANNEQGFAFDFNDLSTMYQDSAGTIPVTGVGQPVGLILDKSKGLVLGVEKKGAATTQVVGSATAATYNPSTSEATCTRVDISNQSFIKISGLTGTYHKVAITNTGTAAVAARSGLNPGDQIILHVNAGQSATFYIVPSNGAVTLTSSGGNAAFTIHYIKEIAGNHAYQTTSASRPILQQTPKYSADIVPKPLDFNTASWSLLGADTSAVNNSFTVTGSVGAGPVFKELTVNKSYTAEVEWTATVPVTVEFLNAASSAGTKLHQSNTGKAVFSFKAADSNFYFRVPPFSGPSTITVTKLTIKEVIGYRTDQNYLAFDGTDDFLQTANINFTSTDKVSLFAGVRKLSDANQALVVELSTAWSANAGSFAWLAPSYNGGAGYTAAARLSIEDIANQQAIITTGYPSPVSSVLTSLLATDTKLRVDGVLKVTNNANKGTGNYGNYPLYIGRRGGSSLAFNGHLYGLIGIGRLTTDTEIINTENAIAKNVGVTL